MHSRGSWHAIKDTTIKPMSFFWRLSLSFPFVVCPSCWNNTHASKSQVKRDNYECQCSWAIKSSFHAATFHILSFQRTLPTLPVLWSNICFLHLPLICYYEPERRSFCQWPPVILPCPGPCEDDEARMFRPFIDSRLIRFQRCLQPEVICLLLNGCCQAAALQLLVSLPYLQGNKEDPSGYFFGHLCSWWDLQREDFCQESTCIRLLWTDAKKEFLERKIIGSVTWKDVSSNLCLSSFRIRYSPGMQTFCVIINDTVVDVHSTTALLSNRATRWSPSSTAVVDGRRVMLMLIKLYKQMIGGISVKWPQQ